MGSELFEIICRYCAPLAHLPSRHVPARCNRKSRTPLLTHPGGVGGCLEPEPSRSVLEVLVAEVAVDLADEDTAVLVTHPSGDGEEIDAAHDAVADEVVATVVEPELRHPSSLSGGEQRFAEGAVVVSLTPGWAEQELGPTRSPLSHIQKHLLQPLIEVY